MLTELVFFGGLVKTTHDIVSSDRIDKQTEKKNIKSFTKIAESQASLDREKEVMEKAVLKLVNRKKAVLSTSMRLFLELYEKIIKINFNEID